MNGTYRFAAWPHMECYPGVSNRETVDEKTRIAHRRTKVYSPRFDPLEARVQLSTVGAVNDPPASIEYPPNYMGPIINGHRAPGVQPDSSVTNMVLNTSHPLLGTAVLATLITDTIGPFYPVSTTWTYTIECGGLITRPTTIPGSTLTSANLYLPVPGTYTIQAETTYQSTNPSAPPRQPTTVVGTAEVCAPTSAQKGGGVREPAGWTTLIEMTDPISSTDGGLGPYINGYIQENIDSGTDYAGKPFPGTNGDWFPDGYPASTFMLQNGELHDQFGPGYTEAEWNAIPVSTTFISFTQGLRYVWSLTGYDALGQPHSWTFYSDLNSLDWSWVKVSATEWEVQ